MDNNFSPSINIVRDADKQINYIPTNNSRNIYHQISSNFKSGLHSFNIIGSYGTGKSAFLLAFSKHLNQEEEIFTPLNGQFNDCKKFKFINIIGQSRSIIETFAEELNVEPNEKDVLDFFKKEQTKLKKKNICLILAVDEFGKFLEHAAKSNPDEELYFIQRLAEYANDARRNFLFITTLHQNFDAYAIGLSEAQRKEWEKVKGRLRELTFNEPVEQLLNLASEVISQKDFGKAPAFSQKLLKVINKTGTFHLLNDVTKNFSEKLFPFDLLSAMTLTLALQRYGQNERSLFNFLQTDEYLGLISFKDLQGNNPYYNLACVYNYLQYNYYSILTSRYNPDYFKWSMIRNSLDRVEMVMSKDIINAQKIVKTIGLLDVLGSGASQINSELLIEYSKTCLGIKNAKAILTSLENKKIILFQSFKNRFKLFEGTDVDIEKIQKKARKEISQITNLVGELEGYFSLSYVPAKAVTYKKGTPRIFQYQISEEPIEKFNSTNRSIDGLVNLIFTESMKGLSFNIKKQPILHGVFTNTQQIKEYILDIKTIDKAFTLIGDDVVAKRELNELRNHNIESLNVMINEQLFGADSSVKWFFEGKEIDIPNKKKFNNVLSQIINKVYPATPTYRNELMNKTSVSPSIHTAKKNYINALIENWNKPNLGFNDKTFPPEKTIYFSLLKETGIHQQNKNFAEFKEPSKGSSFEKVWKESIKFLNSAKAGKRSITEFINVLSKKPYKLKDGLIEFWIISFLFIKREDFALFHKGVYVPIITNEVAVLFFREPSKFEIKTFDIQGVKLDLFNKYRELIQKEKQEIATGSSFQETAKPFLVFYNQLPTYTRQTKSLSHDAIAFRMVIKNAKELEKTFFEDLPSCFGITLSQLSKSKKNLNNFIGIINTSIAELRTAESNLIDRVEKQFLKLLGLRKMGFEKYQSKVQQRYDSLQEHLLYPRQKTFYNRLNSKLPDRKAWLNSLVHALIKKQLNEISDDEELIIFDRMATSFQELDNLLEISQIDFDDETEEAIKLEITSSENEVFKKNIILSKEQKRGAKALEKKFRGVLKDTKDAQMSQAILIKLLKELINNDKG